MERNMTGDSLKVAINAIHVPQRHRERLDETVVHSLAASMKTLGLMTPITIWMGRYTDEDDKPHNGPILIAGLHRLKAAQALGWEMIDAVAVDATAVDRELWEISENLHRAELTVLERAEQVARWKKLVEGQSVPTRDRASKPDLRAARAKGRHKSVGVREIAARLSSTRSQVQRDQKISSVSKEAKLAARKAGLDDNQLALLSIAEEKTAEAQVAKVETLRAERAKPKPSAKRAAPAAKASDLLLEQASGTASGSAGAHNEVVVLGGLSEHDPTSNVMQLAALTASGSAMRSRKRVICAAKCGILTFIVRSVRSWCASSSTAAAQPHQHHIRRARANQKQIAVPAIIDRHGSGEHKCPIST